MAWWLWALCAGVAVGVALWLVSFALEALRRAPAGPTALPWAPAIAVDYVDVDGVKLRFIKTGAGPTLVLLHTLRTQLDLFQTVIPDLSRHFTVYALDYPGHGYSDIPRVRYDAALFADAVAGFLDAFDLRDVTLAGVSIGGVIPLIIAARGNQRVRRVISINPYDYDGGRGLARSSLVGWLITNAARIPLIGETVMRLRSFPVTLSILRGGVAEASKFPPALMTELHRTGNRPWHYRAFISLLRNAASWERAQQVYAGVAVPVLLIFGDKDWSRAAERERTRMLIPSAATATIAGAGHFLPLDQPHQLLELIVKFAAPAAR